MGYSQYFKINRAFTDKEWEEIKDRSKILFNKNRQILAGPLGEKGTQPEIKREYISFNGKEEEGGDYETCYLPKSPEGSFNFCKTGRRPYDTVVVELLKTVRQVAPDAIVLSSDGGKEVFA